MTLCVVGVSGDGCVRCRQLAAECGECVSVETTERRLNGIGSEQAGYE